MNKNVRFVLVIMVCALALGACRKGEKAAGGEATETIAPAAPQPQPTGTDAMTQTVDVEDSRTEADGGVLVNPNVPPRTEAIGTTGATATTGTTAPPPSTTTR